MRLINEKKYELSHKAQLEYLGEKNIKKERHQVELFLRKLSTSTFLLLL